MTFPNPHIMPFGGGIEFVGVSAGSAGDGAPNAAPLTLPAGTLPGDTAVFAVRTDDASNRPIIPTGWTEYARSGDHACGGKVLTAGDISSPPNLMSGSDANAWVCIVFRGVNNAAGFDVTSQNKTASGTQYYTNETISCGAETVPLVAMGFVGGKGDSAGTVAGLPVLDMNGREDGSYGVFNSSDDARFAVVFAIMNDNRQNVTVDANGFGSQRVSSCELYLKAS